MRVFGNGRDLAGIGEFVMFLAERATAQAVASHAGLDAAARLVRDAARAKIGYYQPAATPFLAWAPLAESTIEEKERLGYTGQFSEDDPLHRTGYMAATILHNADVDEAFVGSDYEVAVWQELGTSKMPPRSFLGSAAVEQRKRVVELLGLSCFISLMGEDVRVGDGKLNLRVPGVAQPWRAS